MTWLMLFDDLLYRALIYGLFNHRRQFGGLGSRSPDFGMGACGVAGGRGGLASREILL